MVVEFTLCLVMVVESEIRGYHYIRNKGNIHDRCACSIYLRVALVSLAVDIGGGIYSRMVFNRVNTVVLGVTLIQILEQCCSSDVH